MTKTIRLNNQDTPFTIDTHQYFTGDDTDEMIIRDYNDENDTDLDYDSFDWSYDHKAIVKELATASLEWLQENILDDIIMNLDLVETFSPKFYNYSTDSYSLDIEIDTGALDRLYDWSSYDGNFQAWLRDSDNQYLYETGTDDEQLDWKAMYHLEQVATDEMKGDYLMAIHESSSELWYENTEMILIEKEVATA